MTAAILLTSLSCLIFALWSTRHRLISRQQRGQVVLSADSPGPPPEPPLVSVVIAAKDEEANIEAAVRSMLAQDYGAFEIIVCNDRSRDRTGEIVRRLACEDDRVRRIDIDVLPDGWYGKNHAVFTGFQAARGEWICMTDADCRQVSPRTLSVAMQHAMETRADLLSVLPVLKTQGLAEDIIQPVCGGVMMIWFNPSKVNNPRSKVAYANGAFVLIRRSAYQAVGTHEAIKGMMMEDLHLARRVKQAGLSLRVVMGRALYEVRMYTSLREILRGWSRIFFGSFRTFRRLTVSLALIVIMGLLPYAAAGIGLAMAAGGAGGWWLTCGLTGLAAVAMQLSIIRRFYKLSGAKKGLFWTYPVGCLGAATALVMALSKLLPGSKLHWRGTTYAARQPASDSTRAS